MKLLLFFLIIFPFLTIGQEAIVYFEIKNASGENVEFSLWGDYANPKVMFGETYIYVPIKNGKIDWKYQLSTPTRITFFYNSEKLENEYEYSLFLSPGDEFTFTIDEKKIHQAPIITGKGSENNQPLMQVNHEHFVESFFTSTYYDSLPYETLNEIKKKELHSRLILDSYITQFHPSKEFIKIETLYLDYFVPMIFNAVKGGKSYTTNSNVDWQKIEDSLGLIYSYNNEDILNVANYASSLDYYVYNWKSRLYTQPDMIEKYCSTEQEKKLIRSDFENFPKEKIIDKHFNGKVAEFLYATIFHDSGSNKEDNLPEIFERFKKRYPNSIYIPFITPKVNEMLAKRKKKLSTKTILISDIDSVQTFDEVLEMVKGKTVLLDMWGTWCSPCRSEISNYSAAIKEYYKDEPLDYLYIANNDQTHEEKWRELIPYYKLTGTHILANANLSKDIMTKLNSSGYPTYVIIKKDGTFEVYNRSKGLQLDTLFEQIDRILKE